MKYSVFMEVFLLILRVLIKFENLIEFKRFLMKEQCAIYFGQIQMKEWVGECLLEVQVIHLVKTFLKISIEQMVSN